MRTFLLATLTSAAALIPCFPHAAIAGSRSPASLELAARLLNAKELLGSYYPRSVVRVGEQVSESNIREHIINWAREELSERWKHKARKIADTIIAESDRYGFDPILITAIIQTESGFSTSTVGPVGEIGLMQVRPETAQWLAKKLDMHWRGRKSLFDPFVNIRYGAAYLSYLRDEFNAHGRLYLTAYNMGKLNVVRSLKRNYWPKEYALRVMKNYVQYYAEIGHAIQQQEVETVVAESIEQD